jgi:hypothetical protein
MLSCFSVTPDCTLDLACSLVASAHAHCNANEDKD